MLRPIWHEIPRDGTMPQHAGLHVTMNPGGHITMSRITYAMLGGPKAFVILFDPANSRIGLRPAALTTRNAYPTRIGNHRTGSKVVRAYRLLVEYRLELPHTLRFYDARIEDRTLILDLRTAKQCPRAAGRARSRNADEGR